ncbi:hypothetical protein [Arthrobacter sp. B3I4]|uniref:hypothetical protein n=1 Tax=Arthrobacter sp. B3I4 TaxID=3042267 RepID=UPI00277ECAEF|nr:hypothetical protein [Arthrobacter sp. B3I4]MDQ0755773.1 ammonia channel protein AmtB [Arthrobacter sp. B3I4]
MTEFLVNVLVVFTLVMIVWFLLGWSIYGGERGKARRGGLFAAVYKFVVTPWIITSAVSAVLFAFFWGLIALTGGFN